MSSHVANSPFATSAPPAGANGADAIETRRDQSARDHTARYERPSNGADVPSREAGGDRAPFTALVFGGRPLVAEGLKSLIEGINSGGKILFVTDAADGAILLKSRQVDAILIATSFDDDKGLDFLRLIRSLCPDAPAVVVSGSASPASIRRAADLGASSYIVDTVARDVLVKAVSSAMTGERLVLIPLQAMSGDGAGIEGFSHAYMESSQDIKKRFSSLTNKEKAVLNLIKRGLANKEIAIDLKILEGTVKVHVKSILRKLDAKNRTIAAMKTAAIDWVPAQQNDSHPK